MSAAFDRLEDLASRLMDGSLSPSEERELGEALRASREAREILRSYLRQEGVMTDLARIEILSTSVPIAAGRRRSSASRPKIAPSSPVPRRTTAWAIGAVAAAALVGLLYAALQETPPKASPAPGATARSAPPSLPSVPPVSPRPEPAASAPELPTIAVPARPEGLESPLPARPPEAPVTPPDSPAPPAAQTAEAPGEDRDPKDPPKLLETSVMTQVTLERVEGDVTLRESGRPKPARAGDQVGPGQGLETGAGMSLAVLTFPDGTRLEVRSDTSVRDVRLASPQEAHRGKSVFLHHGTIWANVRPQPADRPFVVGTPRGEARVLGTTLTLHVDADPKGSIRLDVEEGKVRFSRSQDGRFVDVPAGHSVTSAPGADLALHRSAEMLLSFQDGVSPGPDYSGTRDASISEKNPGTNYGHAKSIVAEGEDGRSKHLAQWALLRWDLSSIPPGSRVRSASISLFVTEPSRGAFSIHEPARAWTESEVTWKHASAGAVWRLPGSLGGVERWAPPLGALAPLVKGEYTAVLNDAGVALVQSWVNAPANNFGLILASPEPAAGLHFNAREAPTPETRPKLTVVVAPRK